MIGCLPTQALAFLAVFVYATQAIAYEWKPGLTDSERVMRSALFGFTQYANGRAHMHFRRDTVGR